MIEPGRDLGHVDKDYAKGAAAAVSTAAATVKQGEEKKEEEGTKTDAAGKECEDCKLIVNS